jgi:O-antigen/teichoic acid export membrane protein
MQHAAGLGLLLLLVAKLSPEEYTRFGLLTTVYTLLVPVVSLNLQIAASRLFFDEGTAEGRASVLSTSLIGALVLGLIGTALLLAILFVSGDTDPVTRGSTTLRLAIASTVLCMIVTQFGGTLYRVTGEAFSFLVLICLQAWGLIIAVLLVAPTVGGVPGLIFGYLAAQAVAAVFVLRGTIARFGPLRLDFRVLARSFEFSWPTAVHLVAFWAIAASGRWIGTSALSLASMTPYVLVTQLVAVVGGFQRALFDSRLSVVAAGFASNNLSHARAVIVRTMAVGAALALAIYGLLAAVLYLFPTLLPPTFRPTPMLLALAAGATLMDALYLRGVQILHFSKRTKRQAAGTIGAGGLTVLLGLVLVGSYGVEGLLAALVAGVALQAAFANALAHERRGALSLADPTVLSATIDENEL